MKANFNLATSASIVVANMIGTGVFATLGMQLELQLSPLSILLSWLVGGVVALTGSISYARLSTFIPQSGGEYTYLSKLFSPALGFTAGIISIVAGFAAPLALVSITFGSYLENVIQINSLVSAILLILTLTLIHSVHVHSGGQLHLWITVLKVLIIAGFSLNVFLASNTSLQISDFQVSDILNDNLATSLLFVSFSYSGWNAAVYVAEEINDSRTNLTKALLSGTAIVTMLYLIINLAMLLTVGVASAGSIDVVHHSAAKLWGSSGAKIMDSLISVMLISSASSLVIAGPRVMMKLGASFGPTRFTNIAKPSYSIMLQSFIAILLLISFSFRYILYYTGLALSIFTLITVIGFLFRSSPTQKASIRMYEKIAAVIFILINSWIVMLVAKSQFIEFSISVCVILIIWIGYLLFKRKKSA